MKGALAITLAAVLVACGGFEDDGNYGTKGFDESSFAITNASGQKNLLRTGSSVSVIAAEGLQLRATTLYRIVVRNLNTGSELSQATLLTSPTGLLELTTVAHDLGEFDDVKDEHTLSISVEQDPNGTPGLKGTIVAEIEIPVIPHALLQGHGFQVDELQPPHIFSAQPDGSPANAFVVGAVPDPGEIGAPIYAAGTGLPSGIQAVDLYLVKDSDKWQGKAIPQQGDESWIAGPVVGTVVDGVLQPTALPWQPNGTDIGPYDIIADVDRDGQFDFSFSEKDGADGENKVGLTIQYSAAWHRAKKSADAARISSAAAKAAWEAADAAATAAEAIANGPAAQQKAAAARDAANNAKAQWQIAKDAAGRAQSAFDQELADATTAVNKADEADRAAIAAAEYAKTATAEAANAEQAQKAWETAMAAKMTAGHLLVNLAFDSKSRDGHFRNSYSRTDHVYSYINPPLQKGEKHARVSKVLVTHQSFANYWNNPAVVLPGGPGIGRIPYRGNTVTFGGDATPATVIGTVQQGCTNSPPVSLIFPETLKVETADILSYDVIFDYGNDGYYDIGVDWLDVIGHSEGSGIFSASDILKLSEDQVYGLQVVR